VSSRFQGGLKAVVWTDTLQQIVMMGSSIVVMILGILAVGGLDVMWQRNIDGDRIEFFKYVMQQNTGHLSHKAFILSTMRKIFLFIFSLSLYFNYNMTP
jgi:Na+/proline symporter